MSDEPASQPCIKTTWLIGTLAAFALFVVVGAYSSRMTWNYENYDTYDQQRAAQRYETLAKVRHDEQALLSPVDAQGNPTAEWIDQAKGVVRIPIEEAMAKSIDTLKTKTPGAGAEIVVPAPAPAPGATNAAPATPASPAAPAAKNAATSPAAVPAAATAKPKKK